MNNLKFGFSPTHPGEVLKDEIEYRGISQSRLAEQMGMPYKALNQILNEHRPVTVATAMMFEAALGIPAYSLINIQTDYNIQVASRNTGFMEKLKKISMAAASVAI